MGGRAVFDDFGKAASAMGVLRCAPVLRRASREDARHADSPQRDESECQAPPRDAPPGSAVGRWVRRNQGGLSIPQGRCQAPSKSNRSTRSIHLLRCLAPPCGTRRRAWQPAVGSGRDRGSNRCPGQMAATVISDRDPGQSPLNNTAAAPDRCRSRRLRTLYLIAVAVFRTETQTAKANPTFSRMSRTFNVEGSPTHLDTGRAGWPAIQN